MFSYWTLDASHVERGHLVTFRYELVIENILFFFLAYVFDIGWGVCLFNIFCFFELIFAIGDNLNKTIYDQQTLSILNSLQ